MTLQQQIEQKEKELVKEQINEQDIINIDESLRKVTQGERVKCIYCKKDIHISKLGGIRKEGLFCNDFFCMLELIKENEKIKKEKELAELKVKLQAEERKDKTIIVNLPTGKIEIETEIHDKGKSFNEIKIPEGWRLPTYFELQELRNDENYIRELNLLETAEFVEQLDKLSKERGYVARFDTHSYGAGLDCWYPGGSYSSLGVRFVRCVK